jgi:hypothetical protein
MAKSAQDNAQVVSVTPDKVRLNRVQARRLSQLTNVRIEEIEGRDMA